MTDITERFFSQFATATSLAAGRPWAFISSLVFTLFWLVSGPLFHFSDTWQLAISSVSSVVTFLMVFLIQNSQNRDGNAIQLKLDELIRATRARNHLIGVERLSEKQLTATRQQVEEDD